MDRGGRTNNRTFHSSTLRSFTSSGRLQTGARAGGSSRQAREGRNWIRCLTVCGYIFFVSSPAVLLSYYYTRVWNPKYVNRLVSPPSAYKTRSTSSSTKSTTLVPATTTTGHRPPRQLDFSSASGGEFENDSFEVIRTSHPQSFHLQQIRSHKEGSRREEMRMPLRNIDKNPVLEDFLLPAT